MRRFVILISLLCCSVTALGVVTEKGAQSENPIRDQKLTPKSSEKAIQDRLRSSREAVNAKIQQEYQKAKQKWS